MLEYIYSLKVYLLEPENLMVHLQKTYNHALHDFYRSTIEFPDSSRSFWTQFFLLHLTDPPPGIESGSRIEVCDYSRSSVSVILVSHADNYNLLGSYYRRLFGSMEDIRVHRVINPQYPQGYRFSKLIAQQILKVLLNFIFLKMFRIEKEEVSGRYF